MSETVLVRGLGLAPGAGASLACENLDRAMVERLLASWFAWLDDRAAVTIAPAGQPQAVELRIRRWKTRPDLVLFRWRNTDATRASFVRVRESFEAQRQAMDIELTPKTKKPRAMVISLEADDVFSPAAAVGLANRAFAAAGLLNGERYDLTCSGYVLKQGTRPFPLIPRSRPFDTGRLLVALAVSVLGWLWRRLTRWGRDRD